MRYAIRVSGRVLINSYSNLDEAKLNAQGSLLSRRQDKKAEVLPITSDIIGGLGQPIATVVKNRSGKLVWTDH